MNKKWIHAIFGVCLVLITLLASGRPVSAQLLDNQSNAVIGVSDKGNTRTFKFEIHNQAYGPMGPQYISGAEYQLTEAASGEVIACDMTETLFGIYSFSCELELGKTYYLTETVHPDGYGLSSKHEIKISDGGTVSADGKELPGPPYKITVYHPWLDSNDAHTMAIWLYKVDANTEELLSGAEFTLNGQPSREREIAGKPVYYFTRVRDGVYDAVLKETKAPPGYKLDDTEYKVHVGPSYGSSLGSSTKPAGYYQIDGCQAIDGPAHLCYAITNKPEGITSKQVSLNSSDYTDSATITESNQPYTYRLSYECDDGSKKQDLTLYDEIENGSESRFAGTVTGIDLTGYGDVPVHVYVRGTGADISVPDVFESLPGGKTAGWRKIDPNTFSEWAKVTHVALYTPEFDGAKQARVYADILMASIPDGKNKPGDDGSQKAVTITLEATGYTGSGDYIEPYYEVDGKIYSAGQQPPSINDRSVNIPSNHFWIYWHAIGPYADYDFHAASVTEYDGNDFPTGRESSLPNYPVEDTKDVSAIAGSRHLSGNTGDSVHKLWHFTGFQNPSFDRTLHNDIKTGYSKNGNYIVRDVPGTTVTVTYDDPDPNEPGLVLPKTGGPGVRAFALLGSIPMAASAAMLFYRRRKLRTDRQ